MKLFFRIKSRIKYFFKYELKFKKRVKKEKRPKRKKTILEKILYYYILIILVGILVSFVVRGLSVKKVQFADNDKQILIYKDKEFYDISKNHYFSNNQIDFSNLTQVLYEQNFWGYSETYYADDINEPSFICTNEKIYFNKNIDYKAIKYNVYLGKKDFESIKLATCSITDLLGEEYKENVDRLINQGRFLILEAKFQIQYSFEVFLLDDIIKHEYYLCFSNDYDGTPLQIYHASEYLINLLNSYK